MLQSDNRYDVIINGTGFLLAREHILKETGFRTWTRTKPDRITPFIERPGVMRGEREGEVGWYWQNDPAAGWGEEYLRTAGTYTYSRNVDLRFPGQVIASPLLTTTVGAFTPGAAPRVLYEHPLNSTHVYVAIGRYVYRFDPATPTSWSQEFDTGDATLVITQAAVMDGYVYLASADLSSPTDSGLIYRHAYTVATDADTFTSTTAVAEALAVGSKSTGLVMYRAYRDTISIGGINQLVTKIGTCAAGADARDSANWSGGVNIDTYFGTNSLACQWLAVYDKLVYGAFPDGVYAFDEDLVGVNVLQDLAQFADADNGLGMFVWHNKLIVPHLRGIYAYDGASAVDIGPITGTTATQDEDSRRFGLPTSAICADSEWLISSHYNGTDTYVFVGRIDDQEVVWHTWLYIASWGPPTAAWITSKTDPPTVYLVQQTATSVMRHFELPAADNPLQDPQGFAASGRLELPFVDFGMPGVTKTMERIVVNGDSLSTSNYLNVYYRTSVTGGLTLLGTATSSPTTLSFSSITGTGIQPVIDLIRTGGATTTPVLRDIFVAATARPTKVVLWECTVLINGLDRQGIPRTESPAELLAVLTALEAGTSTFSVTDPIDGTFTALLDGPVEVREVGQQDGAYPLLAANLRLRQV